MKNPTDVVPVAAEVVGRRVVTEVIVTDVVLDHQVVAAKHQRKEESSLVKQLDRILLCLLFLDPFLKAFSVASEKTIKPSNERLNFSFA